MRGAAAAFAGRPRVVVRGLIDATFAGHLDGARQHAVAFVRRVRGRLRRTGAGFGDRPIGYPEHDHVQGAAVRSAARLLRNYGELTTRYCAARSGT